MKQIAVRWKNVTDATKIDEYDRRVFASADVDFHSGLALLSGVLFAEEAVVHIWQKTLPIAVETFNSANMEFVIRDHEKILRAIDYNADDASAEGDLQILNSMSDHLSRAIEVIFAETKEQYNDHDKGVVSGFLTWFMERLTRRSPSQEGGNREARDS